MSITYNPDTKTITVDNVSSTNIFEDIYQADVSNGWGVFQKITDNVYLYENITLKFKNSDVGSSDTIVNIRYSGTDSYFHTFDISGGNINFERCQFNFINSHIECWCGWYPSSGVFKNCSFTSSIQRQAIYCNSPNTNDIVFNQCYIDVYFASSNAKYKDTTLAGKYGYIVNPTEGQSFENVSFYGDHCFYIPQISIVIEEGTINPTGYIATLRNTILLDLYNVDAVNKKNQIFYDNGYEGDISFSYNVIFKLYNENGTQITDKKIKIRDKNGNIIYDGIIGNVKLKEYDYHIVGDGLLHTIDVQDYNSYLPYSYEIYDDLKTYYKGIITSLEPDKIVEITISEETRDIFAEIDNLKTELLKHSARSESLLLSR